jgi:hypothetical protein
VHHTTGARCGAFSAHAPIIEAGDVALILADGNGVKDPL